MLLRELKHYFKVRHILRNPWRLATARRRYRGRERIVLELKGGGDVWIRAGPDIRVFTDIFVKDVYGLSAFERAAASEPPFDTVVDVGGHVGLFTVRASPLAKRVIVCEPVSENADLLRRNLDSVGCSNAQLLPCAVGSHAGEVSIYRSDNTAGHSVWRSLSPEDSEPELVPSRTLPEIFDAHGVDRCSFLKLDCEGGEYPIFFGASSEWLERVDRIGLEYHDCAAEDPRYTGVELERHLLDRGFTVRRTPSRGHTNRGLILAQRRPSG